MANNPAKSPVKSSGKPAKDKHAGLAGAVGLVKTLAHPLRLSILCNLIHNGEMTAGELVAAEAPDFSQSQVSQYLGILRDMGYVTARRDGQVMRYQISDRNVKKVVETLYNIYCG